MRPGLLLVLGTGRSREGSSTIRKAVACSQLILPCRRLSSRLQRRSYRSSSPLDRIEANPPPVRWANRALADAATLVGGRVRCIAMLAVVRKKQARMVSACGHHRPGRPHSRFATQRVLCHLQTRCRARPRWCEALLRPRLAPVRCPMSSRRRILFWSARQTVRALLIFLPPSETVSQPFEFAGELANWFVNWFGELAVHSVSEFALDASPWFAASVRSFALGCPNPRTSS